MHIFPGYRGYKRKLVVSFAWLFLSLLCSGCWSAKEDAAKLEEVQSVWARLPSYPGMQEMDSNTTSGYGKALGGYEIKFRKSDLSIAIEYAGQEADYGWQYAIAVSWSRWVKEA
jgi:hypothetical protein